MRRRKSSFLSSIVADSFIFEPYASKTLSPKP